MVVLKLIVNAYKMGSSESYYFIEFLILERHTKLYNTNNLKYNKQNTMKRCIIRIQFILTRIHHGCPRQVKIYPTSSHNKAKTHMQCFHPPYQNAHN